VAVGVVLGDVLRGVWDGDGRPERVIVKVPTLSPVAREGREAFDRRCAACHGEHASGSAVGPPLVHLVYRPAHHADAAFALAVQRGVAAHHWRFGDMPPQPGVRPEEIEKITRRRQAERAR
jgi:mono/diheme cytochrome c family protein